MTAAEHALQRARVTASLHADEQREHHHDAPARPTPKPTEPEARDRA